MQYTRVKIDLNPHFQVKLMQIRLWIVASSLKKNKNIEKYRGV